VDASDYEQATHIHDFNQPLPTSLANRFSVVHDGGTIEHVFNIPQAFKNCMEMVRVSGHFIQVNEANNYMGHGFWQFCPELIYRIFSGENGFQIKAVLLHDGRWYKVDDPAVHHCRVELMNDRPTYICAIAQRVEDRRIFARFPQQSDYVEAWKQTREPRHETRSSPPRFSIRRMIPRPIKKLVRWGRHAVKTSGPFDRSVLPPYLRRRLCARSYLIAGYRRVYSSKKRLPSAAGRGAIACPSTVKTPRLATIENSAVRRVSAANFVEAAVIIDASRDPMASRRFDDLIKEAQIIIEPVTEPQARIARDAYRDFGKGSSHPAKLNFGDCFASALAKLPAATEC
jgi:uncharacterized protein with PIN domain